MDIDGTNVQQSPVLAAALRYAESGIAVFPVRLHVRGDGKKGVRPVADWDSASSTDPAVIREWFTGSWSDAALAIDCGKSGIVGIDQDVVEGKDGVTAWRALEPPATWRAWSPTGGVHDYYRADPDHPFTVDNDGAVADGVDVRGMGGFMFAPPSVDPRGGAWRWVEGEPEWSALPMVPEVVIKRMAMASQRKRAKTPEAPGVPPSSSVPADPLFGTDQARFGPAGGYKTAEAASALLVARLAEFTSRTTQGSARSHFLAQDLGVLAGHGVGVFWTYESAHETLMEAARGNGMVSVHGEAYVADQARRGLEYGMRQPWIRALDAVQSSVPDTASTASETASRRVDLRSYLDGTYVSPAPEVGMERSDGKLLLYPGRWHTVIGPNGTGKSFLALAHCIAEMRKGRVVVYAHFEEPDPGGTLHRLRTMAPDMAIETIEDLFVWLDCSSSWTAQEWTRDITAAQPTLTILDGINDASTRQGWDPSDIQAPGNYADLFVTPARVCGSAVFSLGHPPKARGRETERHGFGSTAWLDKLEGVGFRLLPSKKPIRDEHYGYAMLYTVKDRYGQVQKGLEPATEKDMDGWYVVGSFWVNSETAGVSTYGIKSPELNEDGSRVSTIDLLADKIIDVLRNDIQQRWSFSSLRRLGEMLREGGVKYSEPDLAPAVDTLVRRGVLDSPVPDKPRQSRSGSVTLLTTASWEGLEN